MKAFLWLLGGLVGLTAVAGGFDSNVNSAIQSEPTYVQTENRTLPTSNPVRIQETNQTKNIESNVRTVPEFEEERRVSPSSEVDSYINVDGNRVQSPTYYPSTPAGASAKCRDGTYSFSQNRRGTCSGHGGVTQWL
jgi:hypothetical protein